MATVLTEEKDKEDRKKEQQKGRELEAVLGTVDSRNKRDGVKGR